MKKYQKISWHCHFKRKKSLNISVGHSKTTLSQQLHMWWNSNSNSNFTNGNYTYDSVCMIVQYSWRCPSTENVGMVSATVDFKPLCYISFANLIIRYITKIYSIVSKSPNIWLGLSRTHVKYFKNNALGQIILEEFNWWWFIIGIKPFDIITSSNS